MISRIALALAAVTAIAPALAQQYPVKPIRIIVPSLSKVPYDAIRDFAPVMGFVKAGRLRVLAITSDQRSAQLPDVPTFAEAGYKEFVTGSWYAVWLPAKTPEAIVTRLNNEIVRIVNLPEVRSRIVDLGAEPIANSPAAFDAFQKAEMTRWAKVIRDSGAKAE